MEYSFFTLLFRTAHAQRNYMRPHLSELGLSPGQPKILRCLATFGPSSQRTLADYCEVDPSAICRILDNMESKGFLSRKTSNSDRRAEEISLTKKGFETFEKWERQCIELENKMLAGISEKEKQNLSELLSKVYKNMLKDIS